MHFNKSVWALALLDCRLLIAGLPTIYSSYDPFPSLHLREHRETRTLLLNIAERMLVWRSDRTILFTWNLIFWVAQTPGLIEFSKFIDKFKGILKERSFNQYGHDK